MRSSCWYQNRYQVLILLQLTYTDSSVCHRQTLHCLSATVDDSFKSDNIAGEPDHQRPNLATVIVKGHFQRGAGKINPADIGAERDGMTAGPFFVSRCIWPFRMHTSDETDHFALRVHRCRSARDNPFCCQASHSPPASDPFSTAIRYRGPLHGETVFFSVRWPAHRSSRCHPVLPDAGQPVHTRRDVLITGSGSQYSNEVLRSIAAGCG